MVTHEPMTVLAPGEEWPEVWAINPGTGFREPTSEPLSSVVACAVNRWMHERIEEPTRLLVDRTQRTKVLSMSNAAYSGPTVSGNGPMAFMGLEVHWVDEGGIRIA